MGWPGPIWATGGTGSLFLQAIGGKDNLNQKGIVFEVAGRIYAESTVGESPGNPAGVLVKPFDFGGDL